jgi:hypothetical protein
MSKFDKDIKVGDLIAAYHSGYHKVTKVERRFISKDDASYYQLTEGSEYSSLIHYVTILDSKLKPKKKKNSCDVAFCEVLTPDIIEKQYNDERKFAEDKRTLLLGYLV